MTLTRGSSLVDVAFAVGTVLEAAGETAVLVGGSAATYYIPEAYQSRDADFVLRFSQSRAVIDPALAAIGFSRTPGGMYEHPFVPFTVEFPPGPLAIGRDYISSWRTERRGEEQLHVLHPLDVVRDRFMHYWAWRDTLALRVAIDVAVQCSKDISLDEFREWTERELRADPSYDRGMVGDFFNRLRRG